MSEYGPELFGGSIIALAYILARVYQYSTRRRLFNKVAKILAKP